MIVELTSYEMEMAALVGVQRILENYDNGVSNLTYNASPTTMWQNGVNGALGEMVLAKAANRYWSKGERGDTDVNGMDVRTTAYESGSLILHPSDDDYRVSVLITGSIGKFKIVGYIRNKEGKEVGAWEERQKGRPCFYVKPHDLIPFTTMEDLETFKRQCAVRQLLTYHKEMGSDAYSRYLREKKIDPQLSFEAREQYLKGNRGEDGVWFE